MAFYILPSQPVPPPIQVIQVTLTQLPKPAPPASPKPVQPPKPVPAPIVPPLPLPPPKPVPAVIPKPPPVPSHVPVATERLPPPPPSPPVRHVAKPAPHPLSQPRPIAPPHPVYQPSPAPPPAAPTLPAAPTSGIPVYGRQIYEIIQANQNVPDALAELGLSGMAVIEIVVAPSGKVLSARVDKSSGVPVINSTALAHARDAQLPPFNHDMPDRPHAFLVPIRIQAGGGQ